MQDLANEICEFLSSEIYGGGEYGRNADFFDIQKEALAKFLESKIPDRYSSCPICGDCLCERME